MRAVESQYRPTLFLQKHQRSKLFDAGKNELNEAAEPWRFGPKAWKAYLNVRDPKNIQDRAKLRFYSKK